LFIWWHVRRDAVWTNAKAAIVWSLLLWSAVIALCELVRMGLPTQAVIQLAIGAAICGLASLIHMRGGAISESDRRILEALSAGKETRHLRRLGLLPVGGHHA